MTRKTQDTPGDPFARFAAQAVQHETPVEVPQSNLDGTPLLRKDGVRVVLMVMGSHAAKYKAAQRAWRDKLVRMARRGNEPTDAERTQQEAALAAAAVVAWNLDHDGVDVPCSIENVTRYLVAADWNLFDVQRAIQAPQDFFLSASSS